MLLNLLKGFFIGIANVIPGVSGGTLAVIFGVYDKLTESIGNFVTASKEKKIEYMKFLAQIAAGAGIGIVTFAKVITFLYSNYPKSTLTVFTLLILPSIPLIVKGEKITKKAILSFMAGAAVILVFMFLDFKYGTKTSETAADKVFSLGYALKLMFSGLIAAGAMIIPGISGSLLLMMIGEYYNVLGLINSFNIPLLTFFGIGVAIGMVGFSKAINFLLHRYKTATLYFITGIVTVSIFQMWMAFI